MSVKLHPIIATLWLLSILLDFALVQISFRKFHREKTRSFALYILFTALTSSALFVCSFLLLGWPYTKIWAVGSALEQLLALCVAIACFKSLFRVKSMPAGFSQRLLSPIILFGFLASALYAKFSHAHSDWFTLELVALQSTTTFIAGVFWVLSFVSDRYGVPWGTRWFGIGLGFLFQFSVAIVLNISYLYSPPSMYWILSGISILSHVFASCIWLKYFLKKEQKKFSLTNEELRAVSAGVYSLKKTVGSIRFDSRHSSAR
jgi:hypothetical protein